MRFGVHISAAGGLDRAPERAADLGCETMQIFVKSNRQWAMRRLRRREATRFREGCARHGIRPVLAHASYLVNLASGDSELRARSWRSCRAELRRCQRLGIDGLVVHPGSCGNQSRFQALEHLEASVAALTRGIVGSRLLLEVTAGQGTALGSHLEELGEVIRRFPLDRVGLCLDSCHLHAAGHRLDTTARVRRTLDALDHAIGFERIHAIHLNDSRGAAGSRLDRHASIGDGTIGSGGFRALLAHRRIRRLPGILETPKGRDSILDRLNLTRLHALAAGTHGQA